MTARESEPKECEACASKDAEIARLRAALESFFTIWDKYPDDDEEDQNPITDDFKAAKEEARRALEGKEP